jgi:tRNA threonylcarbamoyladenosine biosynthesis protein TsaE
LVLRLSSFVLRQADERRPTKDEGLEIRYNTPVMPEVFALDLPDLASTHQLGHWLGASARKGDVLLLIGDLGAGKTSLAQGIATGLAVEDVVTSPTFTLLNEYRGRLPFYHFDFYRLETPEIGSMGLYEYWQEPRGVVAMEWPERLDESLMPDDYLALSLTHAPNDGRHAAFTPHGRRAEAWLKEIQAHAARR